MELQITGISIAARIAAKIPWIPVVLIISFGILAGVELGQSEVPLTGILIQPSELILDLGSELELDSVYLLVGKSTRVSCYCGEPGNWMFRSQGSLEEYYYHWLKLNVNCRSRYLKLVFEAPSQLIYELGVFSNTKLIPVRNITSPQLPHSEQLLDEQQLLVQPLGFSSGTFFDEIYFVRSAMELSQLQFPYEYTHPPLGKLLIAAGIKLAGFNPVGWRIPSLIFGCALIGLVYFISARNFGSKAGIIAGLLIWLDNMHLVYSRAGLVENMVVGFMAGSYLAGLELLKQPKLGWTIACFGLAGLGASVKWYAGFGFLGLLILLFLKLPLSWILLGIATAAGIYLASFIPYLMMGYDLAGIWNLQLSMFSYHAFLQATHPFGSPWWSWPLMLTPLWMYIDCWDGICSSISAIGNPLLWWAGLGFMGWGIYRIIRGDRLHYLALILILGFQWLSYIPIQRVTFIYHFYINTPMLAVLGSELLSKLGERSKLMLIGYLILAGIWFWIYYPVSSGIPVAKDYLKMLRWLPGWHF